MVPTEPTLLLPGFASTTTVPVTRFSLITSNVALPSVSLMTETAMGLPVRRSNDIWNSTFSENICAYTYCHTRNYRQANTSTLKPFINILSYYLDVCLWSDRKACSNHHNIAVDCQTSDGDVFYIAVIFTEVKEQPRISFTALDKAIGMLQQIAWHHTRSQQGAYKFDDLSKISYPFTRNSDTKITTKISIYFHKFHVCTTHLQLVDDACFPNAAIRWAGSWHDLANGRSNNIVNVFLCSCFADVCTSHGLYWCRGALKSQNCWVLDRRLVALHNIFCIDFGKQLLFW